MLVSRIYCFNSKHKKNILHGSMVVNERVFKDTNSKIKQLGICLLMNQTPIQKETKLV